MSDPADKPIMIIEWRIPSHWQYKALYLDKHRQGGSIGASSTEVTCQDEYFVSARQLACNKMRGAHSACDLVVIELLAVLVPCVAGALCGPNQGVLQKVKTITMSLALSMPESTPASRWGADCQGRTWRS